jgi:DoxX-like family
MFRKIAYWVTTVIIVVLSAMGGIMYLSGSAQAVEGFAHVGYPQQLRVLLGAAKLAGAIVLIAPGLGLVKEWAYAGFAFAWIAAFVAHWQAGDGIQSVSPLVLIVFLIVSYLTRPPNRRLALTTASA